MTVELIDAVIRSAFETGAAIAAVPVKDTIKEVSRRVKRTVERDNLVSVQTPQAFRRDILANAFQKAEADAFYGTDESSLVERAGQTVSVVRGSTRTSRLRRRKTSLSPKACSGKGAQRYSRSSS